MIITLIDVTGRYFFNKPIPGSLQLCGAALVCMLFLSIGYTQFLKGNVDADVIFSHFPGRLQSSFSLISSFLSLLIIAFVAYGFFFYALDSKGEFLGLAMVSVFPFKLLMFIGTLILLSQCIADFVKIFGFGEGKNV